MKNKSVPQSALICLFAVVTFAFCNSSARAQTYWTDATGDWFTLANWSNGVPYCGLGAYINNGGTAQITDSGATALFLTLGQYSTNSGTVSVDGTNGGTLLVQVCDNGLLGDIAVGYQGTGTLTISNGGNVASGSGYIAASTSSSAASNGSVTVDGANANGNSTWHIGDINTLHSVLFVGGNENGDGGTALLSITNGGTVIVQDNGYETDVTVGPSGTLTGNGTLDTSSSSTPLTDVKGTLAPSGTLTISGDLKFPVNTSNMRCNVSSSSVDNAQVSGTATLNGKLSVTLNGFFTGDFTLLHAGQGRNGTKFLSYSFTYTGCLSPSIVYQDNSNGSSDVILHVVSTCN